VSERTVSTSSKVMTEDDVVGRLRSGMTIGIGGWASRRKPMSLVRAILRSDLDDLTIVTYGGPEVGMLCAAGKVRRLVFAFVSMDTIPLEPHFRAARQSGAIEATELDEGMMLLGLQAAAWRVPFLPSRVGLGSDLFRVSPELKTVRSPYPSADGGPGEELVAVPALNLDAALVHLNRSDERGNAQFLGPDIYFDDLMLEAAATGGRFVSCERVVPTDRLLDEGSFHTLRVGRMLVDGVVEAPNGAHPTSCEPDYDRDEVWQKEYAATARDADAWDAFRADWLSLPDESAYQAKVNAR
jgi:glutaconate CoA-transferase subunit A